MKGVAQIFAKEMKVFSRNSHSLLLSVIVLLFLFISLFLSIKEYEVIYNDKQDAHIKARHQWINQGEKNPHAAGHSGTVLFKPVFPLYIFDNGLSAYLGEWVQLETHTQHEVEKRSINESTFPARSGIFNPGFILQYLFPLFIIFLSYGAVSNEREQGTWRLLKSQYVSNYAIVMGKYLAVVVQMLLVILPVWVITGLIVSQMPGFKSSFIYDLAILFVAYFVVYLTLIALSISVSSLSKTSAYALGSLIGFILFTAFALPRISVAFSELIYPTPSNYEMLINFDKAQNNRYVLGYKGFDHFTTVYQTIQKKLMDEQNIKNPDSLTLNPFGFAIEATEEEAQKIYDKTYGEITEAFRKQEQAQKWIGIASPFSSLRFFSMALCKTGHAEYKSFVSQAENYRRDMMRTLNMDIAYHSLDNGYDIKSRTKRGNDYKQGKTLWERIPEFSYHPLPLKTVVKESAGDIMVLLLWLLSSLTFMFITTNKML